MTNEEIEHYSRALDEIYWLRTILALEARVREADLELKSFPKSRRRYAEESVERMRRCARGEAQEVYLGFAMPQNRGGRELRSIGAPETLTQSRWENEHS